MKIAHTGVATAKNTSSGTYPTASTISGAHHGVPAAYPSPTSAATVDATA